MPSRIPDPTFSGSTLLNDRHPQHLRPGCDHGDTSCELRTMITRNGIEQYRFQCLICGNKGTALAKGNSILARIHTKPRLIDEDLQRQPWRVRFPELHAESLKREAQEQKETDDF